MRREGLRREGHGSLLGSLAGWVVAHRRAVVAVWVVLAAAAVAAGRVAPSHLRNDLAVPGSGSQRAFDVLHRRFPDRAGDSMRIVMRSPDGFTSPGAQRAVTDALGRIANLPDVAAVTSPYDPATRAISRDGTIALAGVQFEQRAADVPRRSVDAAMDTARRVSSAGIDVAFGGAPVQTRHGPSGSEVVALAAAMLVLLLAFGSLVATAIPLVTAVAALAVGISVVGLLSRVTSIGTAAPVVAAMIGLGVGIDYALLIVTRHRENLAAGTAAEESIAVALATAGRSVLVAGGTVIVAILSLYLIGIEFVATIGLASAVTVATTLLAAVTLLPALLGFAGTNIDRWRVPRLHHDGGAGRGPGVWRRWTAAVQRRRWVAFVGALVVLLVLAVPLLSMRLGTADAGTDPPGSTTRRAYDLTTEGFGPGFNGPLLLAAQSRGGARADGAALARVASAVRTTPGVAAVQPPSVNAPGDAAVLVVVPDASPQDARTETLVHRLRDDVVPHATAGTGLDVYVGGPTATGIDLADRLAGRLPLFIAGVIGLSFLLLLFEFRSLFVPVKAALMNLLSIGAAYGAVVAVFQWGWLSRLLGTSTGPIESFAPMMLFAVLFGLSMDYEVFLLSRVREEYERTGDNSRAVREGIASTARVITAAASVMVIVFASFLLNDQRVVELFGFGLAFAILVDATIVRLVLVPSTMDLAGRANWWLPPFLARRVARPVTAVRTRTGPAPTDTARAREPAG